jgi:lysozyme family protein
MSDPFRKAVGFVLPHECVYARGHYGDMAHVISEKVTGDAGGLTKWGIDQRSHPHEDIERLTQHQAEAIYWANYWLPSKCGKLPEAMAIALFDTGVNCGIGTAARMMQSALGVSIDGIIGPKTIAAAHAQGLPAVKEFLSQRDQHYHDLAAKPRLAQFLSGWLNRLRDLRKLLCLA